MSNTIPSATRSATLYAVGQPALSDQRTEIAFVLDNVADWETLAKGVRAGMGWWATGATVCHRWLIT